MRRWLLQVSLGIFTAAAALAQDPSLKTVRDRVAEFGAAVQERLAPDFVAAGVAYPPARVSLLFAKNAGVLEVYAADAAGDFRFVRPYPVLGASGGPGPKLREGDRQVPEGVYCLRELNPNSLYHLSLWIDYPNGADQARAFAEGRLDPGGEIMIHGSTGSRGCLAMGDEAAEDLFVLAAVTGVENVTVVLGPVDFRKDTMAEMPADAPPWLGEVYAEIRAELTRYPLASPTTR